MADEPQPPAVIPKEVERGHFIETFTLRFEDKRLEVAANAVANRAMMQMNVAKLRALGERVMKHYEDNPKAIPEPKELKVMGDFYSMVDGMSEIAYSNAKTGRGKGADVANSLERLVYAASRGAAAGANDKPPSPHSPEARLKRLQSIGKAKTVEPTKPAEEILDLDE